MTQAGITEIMVAGKEYREFTDFFTDLPEDSWGIRQTPLTGPGGDMVHWSFGKAELLPLTFQQMWMKFWEGISKSLTSVWLGDILTTEIQKPSPYRMTSKAKI